MALKNFRYFKQQTDRKRDTAIKFKNIRRLFLANWNLHKQLAHSKLNDTSSFQQDYFWKTATFKWSAEVKIIQLSQITVANFKLITIFE
jgi:hypothetical protein